MSVAFIVLMDLLHSTIANFYPTHKKILSIGLVQ